MAKFKCQHTGNIVEFTAEHDIETMRKHTEYTEVFDFVGTRAQLAPAPAVKTRKQVTPTEE